MPTAIIGLLFLLDVCHFLCPFVLSLLLVVFWQRCSFCFVGSRPLGYSVFWVCFSVYLSCTGLPLLLNVTIHTKKKKKKRPLLFHNGHYETVTTVFLKHDAYPTVVAQSPSPLSNLSQRPLPPQTNHQPSQPISVSFHQKPFSKPIPSISTKTPSSLRSPCQHPFNPPIVAPNPKTKTPPPNPESHNPFSPPPFPLPRTLIQTQNKNKTPSPRSYSTPSTTPTIPVEPHTQSQPIPQPGKREKKKGSKKAERNQKLYPPIGATTLWISQ